MQNLFLSLMQISIISSILILFVLAVNKLISHKLSLKLMIFLWIVVLFRLLFPVFFATSFSIYNLIPKSATEKIYSTVDTTQTNHIYDDISSLNNVTTADNVIAIYKSENIIDYLKRINFFTFSLLIWCIGALISAFKKIYAGYKFTKIISAENIAGLNDTLNECKKQLNYTKKITVKASKIISTPITYGIFSPSIVLPEKLVEKISDNKLQLILMHELSHIKRKDILRNYIWLVAKALHWFNPLVYIAYNRYLLNVELACDKMVVDNIPESQRYEYSQTLLDVIKMSGYRQLQKTPITVSFCETNTKVRKRVETMLSNKKEKKSAGIITVILAIVLIFACFTTACMPAKDTAAEPESEVTNETAAENNEVYIFYQYDYYDGCVVIGGTFAEKQAFDYAKEAISNSENFSSSTLIFRKIEDLSDDESKFNVVLEDKYIVYSVVVLVPSGQIISMASEPNDDNSITTIIKEDLAKKANVANVAMDRYPNRMTKSEAIENAKEYLVEYNKSIDENQIENLSFDLTSISTHGNLVYLVRFKCTTTDNESVIASVYIDSSYGGYIKTDISELR